MTNRDTNYPSFRKLEVWHDAIELASDVYRATQNFPAAERYGLTSQLRRAAVSVSTNISEGYGRETLGEYVNQLSVARASLNEVETLFVICLRIGIGDAKAIESLSQSAEILQKRLTRLRSKLAERRKKLGRSKPQRPKP